MPPKETRSGTAVAEPTVQLVIVLKLKQQAPPPVAIGGAVDLIDARKIRDRPGRLVWLAFKPGPICN